jgi:hypothetical protein
MKKLFYITIGLGLLIAFSCKKSTPAATPTPAPTSIANLTVDGVAINNLTHSSFINGSNFGVIAYNPSSSSGPELQVTFSGTTTPTDGTYAVTTSTINYGQCTVAYSDSGNTSYGTSGRVNVVTSGTAPNNTLSFSNLSVSGVAGHHTLTGTITY